MADEKDSLDEEDALDESELDGESGAGKKKIILFAALALLLLGGGGAGVYFSGILDGPEEIAETEIQPPPVELVYYKLPETLTNLNGGEQGNGFLKARVVLELTDKNDIERIERLLPRVVDILQVLLRELRIDDLREPQGLAILRRELLARINEVVQPVEVSRVLFHDLLIQ